MSPNDGRGSRSENYAKVFIDGKWIRPAQEIFFDVVNASSEAVVARVVAAGPDEIDRAASAAKRAFDHGPWPRLLPSKRADYVRKLSQALKARMPEVAAAWVNQIGALESVAPFVTEGGRFWFDYYANLATEYGWEVTVPRIDGSGNAVIVREPVGVVAAIAPWNNPFGIMTGKIAPALIAGCTVVMKPAPETPIEAYIIAECAQEVGLPDGVLNLVCADRENSERLVRHPAIDKVSFTGSVGAGRAIGLACAKDFKRCTLELGGKSAAIVLEDADIPSAAATLAQVITLSAGQVCAALSRVIVVESIYDELVDALQRELMQIKVGEPTDPAAQVGPLAMRRQLERVEHYVELGLKEGARLLVGGSKTKNMKMGWYFDPTLFVDVTPEMRIAREEIFGPVQCVIKARNEEDAINLANNSDFGLYGAVFCKESARAYQVAKQVRTGTVAHNNFLFDPSLPFGGFKHSGIGREGGEFGLASFTEIKSIIL